MFLEEINMKTRLARMGGAFALLMLGATAGFAAGSVELASRIDPGQASATASGDDYQSPSAIDPASLSADGRYAVFLSAAANLVTGQRDVNGKSEEGALDVFLADLATGGTTLVSHAMGLPNTTGNRGSSAALISADGRWVLFRSAATDLTPGQQGIYPYKDEDVLLYDRVTGATTLVAATRQAQSGFYNLYISADGRYVTFSNEANDLISGQQGYGGVYLYDRTAGTTRLVSHLPGSPLAGSRNYSSGARGMSADGRFIVFLGPGDLLPGQIADERFLFLWDRSTDALTLIGQADDATLSADGKFVAFHHFSDLRLYSRETGATTLVSSLAQGASFSDSRIRGYSLSADGRYLAFLLLDQTFGYVHPLPEIYDRVSRSMTPASRASQELPINADPPSISADGRFITFASSDPRWVSGQVDANSGQGGYLDVFLFDRAAGKTTLVSHAATSRTTTGNAWAHAPAISADGSRIAYFSGATDLVAGLADLNGRQDLFAYDVAAADNRLVTARAPALASLAAAFESRATAISADGRVVAFETFPSNFFSTSQANVRLYDPATKTTVLVNHASGSATTPAQGVSLGGFLSPDGRYTAFYSNSRTLVPGANSGGVTCLFLFDRTTGVVSFVARLGLDRDLTPDSERLLSKPRFSADGRWLAFTSKAPDVVPGQQEQRPVYDPSSDVFLYDRVSGVTRLVSHSTAGAAVAGDIDSSGPVLSADGRYLAFLSGASDLLPGEIKGPNDGPGAYLYDRVTGATTLFSHPRSSPLTVASTYGDLAMSSDGRYIALAIDAADLDPGSPPGGGSLAIYLYDRVAGSYQRIANADSFGQELALSADGRIVAFTGGYGLLPGTGPGLYLYDRAAKALSFAIAAAVEDGSLALSGDGRSIVFADEGANLVPGLTRTLDWDGTDIFLYDRVAGTTSLVNQWQGSAVTAAGFAYGPLLSADGRRVAFTSDVDLVTGDYNRQSDAYLFSLDGGAPGGPVTLPPCIVFDTRRPANGPALRSNAARVVKAAGACGVPATAKRVTAKVTVFQGTGKGNVRFYPGDLAAPSTGILRFSRGQSRSATFDLPVAPNGAGTLTLLPFVGGNGTVGVSVEIDGYTP